MGIREIDQMMGICDDLVAEAADIVAPYDPDAIAAFAEQLCGLEGLDCDQLRARLGHLSIPGDFRHFQLHNLTTGMPWGGRYCTDQSPVTMDELILMISIVSEHDNATPQGRGVWSETVALPVTNPGLLELGLRYRPLH